MNGVYTQWFSRRRQRVGHLFQGRSQAILVEKESYLLELARYVVLNPARASAVRSARDWPWSSYRVTVGYAAAPPYLTVDRIRSQFDSERERAIRAYRRFVRAGRRVNLWDGLRGGTVLGTDAFIARLTPRLTDRAAVTRIPRTQCLVGRPGLGELVAGAQDKAARR